MFVICVPPKRQMIISSKERKKFNRLHFVHRYICFALLWSDLKYFIKSLHLAGCVSGVPLRCICAGLLLSDTLRQYRENLLPAIVVSCRVVACCCPYQASQDYIGTTDRPNNQTIYSIASSSYSLDMDCARGLKGVWWELIFPVPVIKGGSLTSIRSQWGLSWALGTI